MPSESISARVKDSLPSDEDRQLDLTLRPTRIDEYIGQRQVKENLRVYMKAARGRREALDHVLLPALEEKLYPAMEDYQLDLLIGQGAAARSIKLELPKFTLIGATTRAGLITAPLRGRFGIVFHLDFYPHEDLEVICKRSAEILGVEIDNEGAREIARRSRGTPRIVNRLLRRVRDYAEVDYDGRINKEVANDALNRM